MKRPVSLVIGIIILVLGIVGYSSYLKENPLKLGKFKIGGGGNGSGGTITIDDPVGGIGKQKGNYLYCYVSDNKGNSEGIYIPYNKVTLSGEAVMTGGGIADLSKGTKEEWEGEITEVCYYGYAYNCNISWNGNKVTLVANTNTPEEFVGLTMSQVKEKVVSSAGSDAKVTCKNVTSAPKPTSNRNYSKKEVYDSTSNKNTISTESKTNKSETSNSHKNYCLDWNASGGSDVSLSFVFYCDKNVVQKSVDVRITARFNANTLFGKNKGSYTTADAEKEFKSRYCGIVKDCDISWDKNKTTITLTGTCKSNYAGLSKSTVEEFRSGWEITSALNEICE